MEVLKSLYQSRKTSLIYMYMENRESYLGIKMHLSHDLSLFREEKKQQEFSIFTDWPDI